MPKKTEESKNNTKRFLNTLHKEQLKLSGARRKKSSLVFNFAKEI